MKMKKIINGKTYNTETAKAVSTWCNGEYGNIFYVEETLYRKKTGEYFLYGMSGAAGTYAEKASCNNWSGGSKFIPCTVDQAKEWLEEYGTAEEYIVAFGEPEE